MAGVCNGDADISLLAQSTHDTNGAAGSSDDEDELGTEQKKRISSRNTLFVPLANKCLEPDRNGP